MTLNRLDHVGTGKAPLERKLGYVQRVYREDVAMRDGVIPGRARAVVAEIIAIHVAIGGKPIGKVIDALTCAIKRQRAGFTAWRNAAGIGALGNLGGGGRDVDQAPMVEINTRQ